MIKTLKNLFKQDKERFVVPKGVQDVIPIKAIFDDGIFQVGKDKYSKSYKFTDINYAVASRADKEAMFLEYEITAYLDTSVGNDYQNKDLIADFKWWVEETGNLDDSPKTGDTSNILLWAVLAAGSLSMMILLLVTHRRKEDEENV